MPRHARISPDGFFQHVINRGDHREDIFHKSADFAAFQALITEAAWRVPMRIIAYCIMRNHFHLLLWPYRGSDLPAYMQLVMNLHIQRYLRHYPPSSPGHIYQGRYRNVLVEDGPDLWKVARYVDANPVAAGIVRRAEDYKWSSASRLANRPGRPALHPEPIVRSREWLDFVNAPLGADVVARIEQSVRKGLPIGSDDWVRRVVAQYGLVHTTRDRGRPRVYETLDL
jgi:putative transposase